MCEPTTWIAIAGLVLTAAAGVQQAKAQKASAQAQEEQAAENAKAAGTQARNTELSAQVEEDRRRQLTRQQLGTQRSILAANNLDMSTGSALEILGDTAAIGEQDALTIRANAAREAWGYRTQAVDYTNQGAMARATGKNQVRGTYLTTAASMTQQAGGLSGGGGSAPRYSTKGSSRSVNYGTGFGAGAYSAGRG